MSVAGMLRGKWFYVGLFLIAFLMYSQQAGTRRAALEAQLIEHSDIADHCVAQGRATREELREIANELREFGRTPDTLWALPYGEAVGWKPVSVI